MNPNDTIVQTALTQLEQNLQKLAPAIEHIRTAQAATEAAAKAVDASNTVIAKTESSIKHLIVGKEKEVDTLLQNAQKQLKAAVDAVNSNITTTQKSLQEFLKNFEEQSKKSRETSFNEERKKYDDLVKKTSDQLDAITQTWKDIAVEMKDDIVVQKDAIAEHITSYEALSTSTKELISEIQQINFPNRLDKIDLAVSATSSGIQNAQTNIQSLSERIAQIAQFKTILYAGLVIGIVNTIGIFLLLFKK